jgi:ketosteroid isomerase-like protein
MLRRAQFPRFRDGKVVKFCSITDTLGAAEQAVGHA